MMVILQDIIKPVQLADTLYAVTYRCCAVLSLLHQILDVMTSSWMGLLLEHRIALTLSSVKGC